jgi:hypothetical protein
VVIYERQRRSGDSHALAGKCIESVHLGFCPSVSTEGDIRVGIGRLLPSFAHVLSISPFFMATTRKTVVRSNKPVQAFRMRGISASVFANEVTTDDGRELTRYDVSVQRRYRDGDEFKTTTSFRRDDLPILQLLARRAWEFIVDEEAAPGKDEDE